MIWTVEVTLGAETRTYRVRTQPFDNERTALAIGRRRFRAEVGLHPYYTPAGLIAEIKGSPVLPGFNDDRALFEHFESRGGSVTQHTSDDFEGYVVRMPHERLIHFYRAAYSNGPIEKWSFVYQSSGHYDEHSRYWNPATHRQEART